LSLPGDVSPQLKANSNDAFLIEQIDVGSNDLNGRVFDYVEDRDEQLLDVDDMMIVGLLIEARVTLTWMRAFLSFKRWRLHVVFKLSCCQRMRRKIK